MDLSSSCCMRRALFLRSPSARQLIRRSAQQTTVSSRYNARDVANKIRHNKSDLEDEVREFASSLAHRLPDGYGFREAGSFWSYLLHDVTDIDLMFLHWANETSTVSIGDAEMLHSAAEEVLPAVVKYRAVYVGDGFGPPRIEQEYNNWDNCHRMILVRTSSVLLPPPLTWVYCSEFWLGMTVAPLSKFCGPDMICSLNCVYRRSHSTVLS
jgi:hypothetical protein